MATIVLGKEFEVGGDLKAVRTTLNHKSEHDAETFLMGLKLEKTFTLLDGANCTRWVKGIDAVRVEIGDSGKASEVVNTQEGVLLEGQILYVYGDGEAGLTATFIEQS